MNIAYLITQLEKAILLSKGTKIQKVIKAPIKMLYSQILINSEKTIKTKANTFWDENMFVIIPEVVSINIYRYGFFEEGLTKMVLKYLKAGMTFLDIGAHFGYFTLLGSHIVGQEGQVHSFEPTSSTFKILMENVSDKNNVVLNNKAVFSQEKFITINDYGIEYSAFNSMYGARLPEDILKKLTLNKYEIEAVTIDGYVENKGIKPDFIKIDAESAEYEILLGMERTIAKFYPIISIEVGDFGVEGVPASKKLISYLENKSYKPYEFKDGEILLHVPKNDQYKYDNILFLPN
jgi:FkbM family methyltransferase